MEFSSFGTLREPQRCSETSSWPTNRPPAVKLPPCRGSSILLFKTLIQARHDDLVAQIEYQKAENEILRRRLPKRVAITSAERTRLVRLGRQRLAEAVGFDLGSHESPRPSSLGPQGDTLMECRDQLLLALLAAGAVVSGAASETTPEVTGRTNAIAQEDIFTLRTQLLETQDQAYVQARSAALMLAPADFDSLLTLLEAADRVSLEQLVASALRVRREHPGTAAEFDGHLQQSIDHPRPSQSGKPIYAAWWPYDRLDVDALAFEAVAKLSLPSDGYSLRQSFMDLMERPNPENVDRILFLAMEGRIDLVGLQTAVGSNAEEQIRITPILVELHKLRRQRGHLNESVIHALVSFGTPLQLAALNEIREFELAQLPAEGFMPWSDSTYKEDLQTAFRDHTAAKRALTAAQLEGAVQGELDDLAATEQQRRQALKLASRRLSANGLWEQLEGAIAKLSS